VTRILQSTYFKYLLERSCTLCLTKHHARRTCWRSGGIAPRININTRGEWPAIRSGCFTPRGRSYRYRSDRRLGGSQSRSGRGGEKKKILAPAENRISMVQPIAESLKHPGSSWTEQQYVLLMHLPGYQIK
jgi:hypothetical protein